MHTLARIVTAVVVASGFLVAAPAPQATAALAPQQMEPQKTLKATHKVKRPDRVQKALKIMRAQLGDPYRYGAAGPNAFDCSGLVFYAAKRAGIKGIPRTSGAQAGFARRISKGAMRPGDLMFFSNGGGVYHVGVWVGKNRILHSPSTGGRVRIDPIWTSGWYGGTLRRG